MDKRTPKNPIHFQLELNKEQVEAKKIILQNKITVLKGGAGSGKSALAANVALDMLFTKQVGRVILSRPLAIADSEMGFLPGNIDSKLAPYIAPIYENMFAMYNREKIESLVHEGKIEIIPLAFMRGRNLSDCLLVMDESQNITDIQMQLVLSRLCKGSKMILCGDTAQIDLKDHRQSGFDFICDNLKDVPDFKVIELKTNHRDCIVTDILEIYANRK